MYSIDTSALISGWVRNYPPQTFLRLWEEHIEMLIATGNLRASKEVLVELERQDDELYQWAKERESELFVEITDPVQEIVTDLMDTYYNPAKPMKGINGADPFVIALAAVENPNLTVVSSEHPGSSDNPKIPYVCRQRRLRHINFLELIQEQGWTF